MSRVVLARSMEAATTPGVVLREFEEMVDSSLRVADRVDLDDQGAKGEQWTMRGCKWVYMPYRFRVCYHVFQDTLQIVYFQYQHRRFKHRWRTVTTTEKYRGILQAADRWRRAQP